MRSEPATTEQVSSDQVRSKRVELIVRQLEVLPTLPVVATKVLQATTAKETSVKEVISLIESDQSLTAKILGLTRKAHLGLGDTIGTVEKAVVMLGFDAIRNAVLSVQVFETFGGQPQTDKAEKTEQKFDRQEFWKHCLAVGCAAQLIVEQLPASKTLNADEVFVCGLLHDLGKVALDACLPKSFTRVVEIAVNNRTSIADVERRILGLDHAAIGKRLAEHWQLPAPICHAIWLHHHKSSSLPAQIPYRDLVDVIYLADLIAREQRIGFSGNYLFGDRSEPVATRMGIKSEGYQKILMELRKRMGDRAALIGLDEINSEQLYQQALQGANAELGRLNQSITVSNRKLKSKARYFDAINELHRQLSPSMPVIEIVEHIAVAVRTALDVPAVAAYREDRENRFLETAISDEAGTQNKLFELPNTALSEVSNDSTEEKGFLIDPPGQLIEVIAYYAKRLNPNPAKVIPLMSHNQMIGGIVISADALTMDRLAREQHEVDALSTACGLAIGQSVAIESKDHLAEELLILSRQMKDLEEKLIEVRCIAATGEMAAGAAHELNNPLSIISGRAQLLQDQEPDADKQKALNVIVEQATIASDIITELMDFAKPVKPQRKMIELNEFILSSVEGFIQSHDLKPGQIQTEVVDEAGKVYCDRQQLQEALKALMANALEATGSKELELKVRAIAEDDGQHVQIRIQDNGPGMEPKVLSKAIEPFFSARKAGRGRGLGLSRAYRYIQSNNGNLWLESVQGMGTTAFIRLPAKQGTSMDAKG
jgi:signal transduction histidine kinase/HD-like signal output (HDOD) protein